MNQTHDNLDVLLSRVADGDLTADERAALERVIAADPAAAREAASFARLAQLLAGWRALPASVDYQALRSALRDCIAEEAAFEVSQHIDSKLDSAADLMPRSMAAAHRQPELLKQLSAVDRLVAQAVGPVPEVNWDALQLRIAESVRTDAAQRKRKHERRATPRAAQPIHQRTRHWIASFARPLAVAAALGFVVVWWSATPSPTVKPPIQIAEAGVTVRVGSPSGDGRIVFSFNEGAAEEFEQPAWSEHAPHSGGMAIAITPPKTAAAQPEPDRFEEAYLF